MKRVLLAHSSLIAANVNFVQNDNSLQGVEIPHVKNNQDCVYWQVSLTNVFCWVI